MPPYLGIIRELPTGNRTGVGSFRVDRIDRGRMPRGTLGDRKENLREVIPIASNGKLLYT